MPQPVPVIREMQEALESVDEAIVDAGAAVRRANIAFARLDNRRKDIQWMLDTFRSPEESRQRRRDHAELSRLETRVPGR